MSYDESKIQHVSVSDIANKGSECPLVSDAATFSGTSSTTVFDWT